MTLSSCWPKNTNQHDHQRRFQGNLKPPFPYPATKDKSGSQNSLWAGVRRLKNRLPTIRKLCGVLHHAWQGEGKTSPVASPSRGAPVHHSCAMHRLAVAPPIKGAFKLPRYPHDDLIKTKEPSCPLEPRPTVRRLDTRQGGFQRPLWNPRPIVPSLASGKG